VAEACLEIKADPANAARYTARGNLVAVVSNGSAVLGLGNIGALASKPVMEGKAVLFKKFANIDCFDLEVNESDPEKLAEIVCALEPTFGAINLEDIKAPDCFIVERICRERMNIPVFHDDQHGTAIVVGAAATNALQDRGQAVRGHQGRLHRRRGGGDRMPQHAPEAGRAARKRLALRSRRAGLRGPRGGDDARKRRNMRKARRPRRWMT
jgi:malic enzyme